MGNDNSGGARFSRAIARCMDDANYLSRILDRIDIGENILREADVTALYDTLNALLQQIQAVFYPGKTDGKTNTCPQTNEGEHAGEHTMSACYVYRPYRLWMEDKMPNIQNVQIPLRLFNQIVSLFNCLRFGEYTVPAIYDFDGIYAELNAK